MTQGTLARKLFLILHDSFTGKPGVSPEGVKYGLVTAALADLVIQGRLGVEGSQVVVVDRRPYGLDDVGAFVVETVQQRSDSHVARSWIESFTEVVYELVARGLVADGIVRRENGGRRVVKRNPDRFPAVDLLRAAGPRIRLEHMLRSPHDLDPEGVVLAGIIHSLRLDRALAADGDRVAVRNALGGVTQQLPADVRELVENVAMAVAAVSLDFRRL
jgi:hypothetical protein